MANQAPLDGVEFLINGEPTDNRLGIATRGALRIRLEATGRAAHSAYPHLGESAINRMVAAIAEINLTDWGSHDLLGKTTVNVGVVRGGERPNIIPAEAECELIFRLVTTPEEEIGRAHV